MKDQLVLIIGAMKCGTTSLFDHLAAHPNVASCSPKEPGFFAFDDIFDRGENWYASIFDFDPKRHSVALDGSTDYSKFPHCGNVPQRIQRYGADPKLLYLMRDPIRRIESHARHVQHARCELGQIVSPRKDHGFDSGISDISIDISKYATQIDQYASFLDRGRLKLLTLEELSRAPQAAMADVCGFLDIEDRLLPEKFGKQNRGSNIRREAKAHPLWEFAKSIAPLRNIVKAAIPDSKRDRLRAQTAKKVKISGRFQLNDSEKERVLTELSSDLKRLRDVYGVDIKQHWGINI